uniref:Chlorophyllase type 0 n=1 Tax=Chenopodium album TaxID=3559 RepID=CLH0_CHEAL|nr:RecName: Full=Chlorophyllase type 0; AltName: Full=CaCLH0; AltName: Full=Chlorophyll-chlorophyllido hydrolase 0; Short=Chlase 0; Flags: Precursor [Chenopodium album]AAF27045.1 CaCLH [Chenopodium album]BAA93635.1 chlorophyllase [Chenopodium album]
MAKLLLLIFGVFIFVNSQAQTFPTILEKHNSEKITDVFHKGNFQVTNNPIRVKRYEFSAPEPLIIISPKEAGVYPVLLFIHGTMLSNEDYSLFFNYIASHGFIVVAPKLFRLFPPKLPSQQDEIDMAASVANWMPLYLQVVLQRYVTGVEGDLEKLAISGHSRGGKSAFALALGFSNIKLDVTFSALIGVDPVAGRSVDDRTLPHVLTYKPNSFNLSIPVTVIGSGLGNHTISCAPNHVSHQQFYDECKENSSHFVITKYGHMDMLNEFRLSPIAVTMSLMCAQSFRPKATMRRTLGGIMVAFLNAYFRDDGRQYYAIIANRSLAPTNLFAEKKGFNFGFATTYAQL